MKKLLLVVLIITSINLNAQEKFTYDKEGLTDFIVVKVDSMSQSEIYAKTIDWIKDTYKNPDEVIKAKFENEKVRFNGFKSNALSTKVLGLTNYTDARYSIEISFKNGRLKFNPINLEQYAESSQYVTGGWYGISMDTGSWLYKKSGKLKRITKKNPSQIESIFNDLATSLKVFLLKKTGKIEDKSDDW